MSSIPLPALDVRPPAPQPGPLQEYASLQSLISGRTQQQIQQQQLQGVQQENQLRGYQLQDQQTLRALAPQFVTKDDQGKVTGYDFNGFLQGAAGASVNPQLLQQMRMQQATATKNMADADEATRNNELAKNKAAYEVMESVRGLSDPQQRQAAYTQGIARLQRLGVNASQFPQQVPDNDRITAFEAPLGMHAQAIADAKTQADTQEATSKASEAAAQAALANVKLKIMQGAKPGDFDAQIDQLAPAGGAMGALNRQMKAMVNPALARGDYEGATKILQDGFNQVGAIAKETNPSVTAARAQQAALVAQTVEPLRQQILVGFQNNKDARDKIESSVLKPFQEKMDEIGQLQAAVTQAQAGNIAAARATLYKVIGVAQPQGTHRVAPTEVTGFSGMGSIPQRIAGSIANALSGDPWTPQMVADIKAFGESQAGAARSNLSNGIDNVNKLYDTKVGQGLMQNTGTGGGGGQSGGIQVTDPLGGVHTFPDQASADNFKRLAKIK